MLGVVVRMLVADDPELELIGARRLARLARGQLHELVEKAQLFGRVDLYRWRCHLRIVECADGELDRRGAEIVGERRSTRGAEAAPHLVGTLEPARLAARPGDPERGYQRAEEAAEGLLTHAAMADRGAPQPPGREAHRAALTAAGQLSR